MPAKDTLLERPLNPLKAGSYIRKVNDSKGQTLGGYFLFTVAWNLQCVTN